MRSQRADAGSSRSARGRRSSASAGCGRCSRALGDPQLAYPSVHVVGTNGKSTRRGRSRRCCSPRASASARPLAARAALGRADHGRRQGGGLRGGARAGPARGRGAGRDAVRGAHGGRARRVRGARRRRRRRRGGARRPARRDERAALARSSLLTNVGLEHTDVLGETREEIAAEKLAVVQEGDGRRRRAGRGVRATCAGPNRPRRRRARGGGGVPRPSGRRARSRSCSRAGSSGAATRSSGTARTTPTAPRGCVARLDRSDYTVVASILRDKDVDAMLRSLAQAGSAPRRDDVIERPRARGRRARTARRAAFRRGRGRRRPGRGACPRPRATAPCS